MLKVLRVLLGTNTREITKKTFKPALQKRSNDAADFRSVEIAPSLICCEAAKLASGKRHLLHKAPRVPLVGCTMPTACSCAFRKRVDRRDGDRRLLGAGTSRWFSGVEGRSAHGRRLAER